MRKTWDEIWMEVADVIGQRSLCSRAKVGCVIATQDNRIVSTGYNGPPAGFDHHDEPCTEWCTRGYGGPTPETHASYGDCPALHAEANALSVCDRSAREGGKIYITGNICFNCAKLIANSGLRQVHWLHDAHGDHRGASGNAFLVRSGLEVYEVSPTYGS